MDKLPYREFLAMIKERTREADIPYIGSFELTPLCNLDCKMCYVHLQDPSVRHRMLSGEQWISLIQQAIDEGMMETLLTGGEAMTHPAFWDIYMFLINHALSHMSRPTVSCSTKRLSRGLRSTGHFE